MNGRGFEVLISSQEEADEFIRGYSLLNDRDKKTFFAKWVRFETYRKVVIGN